MTTETKKRLERLRDDLIELRDADLPPCGFGLITLKGEPGIRLLHHSAWQFLERWVECSRESDDCIRFELNPYHDPDSVGQSCLRWWGNRDRIAKFQQWAASASVVLRKAPDVDPNIEVGPGYHGVMPALVTLAKSMSSPFVRHSLLLSTSTISPTSRKSLPLLLRSLESPLEFAFDDVSTWAERFALEIFEKVFQEPSTQPRLVVDLNDKSITLNGQTRWPGDVFVHILHELLRAQGRSVSRSEMRKNPVLAPEERLDRVIDSLRKKMNIDIVSSRKGYALPTKYLA